jgi:hypothetical protein
MLKLCYCRLTIKLVLCKQTREKTSQVFFANEHMEGMKLIQGNRLLKGSCTQGGVIIALLQV